MEDEVFSIMQKYINKKLSRDEYGNYYVTIGNSETLFVSHLDVVAKQKLKVTKIKYKKDSVVDQFYIFFCPFRGKMITEFVQLLSKK